MRAAGWLAAVLCPLALLGAGSRGLRFHPGQETLVKRLSSYEIVTPVRVNEFGEAFPRTHHFSRRKRSSGDPPQPLAFRTHYQLAAYGQVFQLNLSADAAFIAAQYTTVHVGAPREQVTPDLRHCFYRGHVNAQEAHMAVFSICGGLMGTFKTHDGEYFLEPLMKTDGGEHEDEHNKPHLIYRHEEFNKKYQKSHKPCEVSENKLKESTLLHPDFSNLNEEKNVLQKSPSIEYAFKNLSLKDGGNNPHSRKKRFLSYPRYVEVMVTADTKMVRHHGQNLQHYILTLMSIVAAIYKDSSIGNLINIVIVKLIVIHNEQEGPAITFNAATTLRNFCLWQQAQNTLDDAHPSHHDTAVLITREDICRAREKCDTLGLAELGTMCDPLRSCSISEENGLSAAFTIAHELGHVFNVPHDDSFKCKEAGIKHQYHVMAPTLNYHTSPWTWSKCSQKYITEFLDTGYGECLLDKPSGRIYDLSSQLPGSMYDVNKQCELMFGLGSQVCPYLKQCKRLWCTSTEGVHKGCRTQHMPLADGTVCGVGMHCRHGICVSRDMETRPVDGEWGPWGPYSSCSRTCGGGIKSTTRLCNRPEPRNGGKYCVGRRMKFRSCNTDSCPKGKKDFREQQCSEFDGKHFNINGLTSAVRWLPKYSGKTCWIFFPVSMKDRCKLFCRVSGTTSYYQLKDRVADGTPCGAETNDLCVQGLCRQAGCDHVLNSKARRDKCGICGGDNSSCKTLAGTFNSARYGYNVVVKIPKGATNIDIRQHSYSGKPEDDNYLALSDIHGNFILNGNFVVSMSKREINIQGAIFEYNGSNNTIERINSTDRIEEELTLQVLCVGNLYNPDVRYSFNIPIEDRSELFTWDPYGPWQDCSRMCRGIRRRRMTCIRKSDHAVVSDQRCEFIPLVPDVSEECNTECELRWHSIGKSDCTSKCGPGYRSIEIRCMKYSVSKGLTAPVDDRYCADQQKPPTREPCHGDCMLTSWHYTEWSECSRSCERGVRTREAFCLNNLGRHLPDRECQELPRVVTQSCNEFLCPSWSVSEWSECPVTCGKGMKHRQVWCQLNDEQLRDDFCNPNDRPGSVTPCELHECASWQVGPWGSCTVTCGRGYQMRAVKCVTGTYRVILDDDRECNAATRPRDNQECELPACPETTKLWTTSLPLIHVGKVTQWRYGSWTPCSASCGKGDRARYVSCRDAHGGIADESFCAHLPRPAEVSSCFSPCGEWQVGNWSPCTVTCDSGTVTRQVICVNYHQQINENYCDPEGRPSKERECNMPPCPPVYHHTPRIHDRPSNFPEIGYLPIHHPQDNTNQWNHPSVGGYQWRTGPWGACSSTCAGGFHRRVVVCQDEEGRSASYCDEATKPPESRHCDSGPCPRWNYGNWGECTQTCGDGIKTRLVICQLPTGQMLGDQNCEILDKPPNMAQCNVHSCPGDVSWHRGPWKSCSVSCGKGLKYRDVHCFNSFQAKIEEGNCRHLKKPRTYKICRAGRCPAWKASRWKECSVSCGVGIQQRDIYCQLKGLGQVNEAACNHAARPTSQRRCWLPACMQYHWLADEWEDCSTSYRREEIHRKVKCVDEKQIQVDESFCDPATKPPSTKNCRIAPTKYVVLTGDLSQCSASCGVDYRQRITYCVGIHSVQNKHAYGLRTVAYRECPVTPSPYIYTCNIKGCSQGATWRVGKWTKCSVTCGVGVKERTVACMTENGLSSDLCLPRLKPDTRKICHAEECEILSTCKDIQVKKGIRKDGEYLLNIKGRMIKIYCSGMHLENPREYLTLVKGEADNFSEVYGFRLQNPYECPFNGSRRQDCACRNDYLAAGFTIFSKIRFDVDSMQIRTTDFLFAQTILGRAVPFATAGDCYSAARCPQGQFSINLAGTGLRLSSTVRWIAQGNYATADIHKSHDGTKIYGRCGGFCGKCIPNTITGLQLQIQ
ncbi:A disintegrin and metalloproteinase with thrombospondin motifs 20 isoform X1 [Anas platyrhynchos]|uniref:A disintegrin and metalloproteinase with thrombospondin motifs 20 isoform X1 n=2 Tax=Anas platyrhynchos TaxID=8839 RepID=UPI000F7C275A|nr:A disintegrin and metalloproteinase with thrombospondin motifs 20 isoform X1 [Anas platyrhynchos]|eukprot:XP_027312774.1 A disintegrin and metalloproteinase with thrombospondin motifs 20 isoform X1 [Anas platyrhynchos]